MSIERLLAAIDAEKTELPVNQGIDCYIVTLGEKAKDYSVSLVYKLREAGISSEIDYENKKMKGQFKTADRLGARFIAILGEDELAQNKINVKDAEAGEQREVVLDELIQVLKADQKQ
ncbi:Histidine--tRNA ligase [Bacillus velezensis]|nr:Histidine--tRNA ligase [Bacillus velezensis]